MRKIGQDDSLPYGFEEIDEGKLIILEEMVASGLQSMTLETYYKVGGNSTKPSVRPGKPIPEGASIPSTKQWFLPFKPLENLGPSSQCP